MNSQKKVYETPELTVHGSIESITQAFGDTGSGDWFSNNIPGWFGQENQDTGCVDQTQWACSDYPTGS